MHVDVTLRFGNHLCVSNTDELKRMILEEVDGAVYVVYPRSTKMCKDLKETYW